MRDSMLEICLQELNEQKKSLSLEELVNKITQLRNWSDDERISVLSKLHTQLTMDGRFVILADGKWDLRINHPYDVVNPVHSDFDFDDDIELDEEEEDYDTLETTIVKDEDEEEDEDVKKLVDINIEEEDL